MSINIETTYFVCLESFYFWPFIWLGFTQYFMEYCYNVCLSCWQWNISRRLSYHLSVEIFEIFNMTFHHV